MVDLHADLVSDILEQMPESLTSVVRLIDLADERGPVGINLLDTHIFADRDRSADSVVRVARGLWEQWVPRMQSILEQAAKNPHEVNAHPVTEEHEQYIILEGGILLVSSAQGAVGCDLAALVGASALRPAASARRRGPARAGLARRPDQERIVSGRILAVPCPAPSPIGRTVERRPTLPSTEPRCGRRQRASSPDGRRSSRLSCKACRCGHRPAARDLARLREQPRPR